jgi:hypothetical protein
MPRHPHPTPGWGTLEIGYTDESGAVASDVYRAAGRVWRQAQDYAARVLQDFDEGRAHTHCYSRLPLKPRGRAMRNHT